MQKILQQTFNFFWSYLCGKNFDYTNSQKIKHCNHLVMVVVVKDKDTDWMEKHILCYLVLLGKM
jgi:hypothetical protein